jgi:acyl-CoA dehydrogenase
MYLDTPKKFLPLISQARRVAQQMLRPISRKYDLAEHTYPRELDMLAAIMDGMNDGGELGAGASKLKNKGERKKDSGGVRNGSNLSTVLALTEMCWGDVGLALSLPRQGLGNAAIAAVANEEQLARFGQRWAAMAITEPASGSDSASIRATAILDGEHYVLNGEKIFITCGERADLVVVWASVDPSAGRAAIKSFVVEKGTPGMRLERLEHKLGIRASDTATILFEDCRVPKENLLGSPEVDTQKGFGGVMQTFDNTRPVVAAMALGVGRAALEKTRELFEQAGFELGYRTSYFNAKAVEAELYRMEAELEAARLLTLKAAWMADNGLPNSMEASMCKAKAGLAVTLVTQKAVEILGPLGYSRKLLVEKWMRDAKINDIFEGTQQINLMIVARRILGYSSKELN